MNILVINAGSSSLKYQLMNPDTGDVTAKGLCERIGLDGRLTHKVPATGKKVEKDIPMPTHKEAIEAVMAILVDPVDGVIKSVDEIDAVGHRVLHGGDKFVASCLIDDACKQAIRDCIPLGPLHNPANLMGIEACEKAMPGKPQVAVFDTAFHMTMPPKAYRYAIPTKWYTEEHLRRYGFRADGRGEGKPRDRLPSRQRFFPVRRQGRQVPGYLDGSFPSCRRPHGHPRGRHRHLCRAVHDEP